MWEGDPKKIAVAGFWSDGADRKVTITIDGQTVATKKDTIHDKGRDFPGYVVVADFEDGPHEAVLKGKVGRDEFEIKRPIEVPWKRRSVATHEIAE